MTRDRLEAMLTPDAFTAAIQAAWDAFRTRSNMRRYGVPDPHAWCDATIIRFMEHHPRAARHLIVRMAIRNLLHYTGLAIMRGHKNKARHYMNLAKYLLTEYT